MVVGKPTGLKAGDWTSREVQDVSSTSSPTNLWESLSCQAPFSGEVAPPRFEKKNINQQFWAFFFQKKTAFLQILLLHLLLSLEASHMSSSNLGENKFTPKTTQPTHYTALRHYVFPCPDMAHPFFFSHGRRDIRKSCGPAPRSWWWNFLPNCGSIHSFEFCWTETDSLDASNSNENHDLNGKSFIIQVRLGTEGVRTRYGLRGWKSLRYIPPNYLKKPEKTNNSKVDFSVISCDESCA